MLHESNCLVPTSLIVYVRNVRLEGADSGGQCYCIVVPLYGEDENRQVSDVIGAPNYADRSDNSGMEG